MFTCCACVCERERALSRIAFLETFTVCVNGLFNACAFRFRELISVWSNIVLRHRAASPFSFISISGVTILILILRKCLS